MTLVPAALVLAAHGSERRPRGRLALPRRLEAAAPGAPAAARRHLGAVVPATSARRPVERAAERADRRGAEVAAYGPESAAADRAGARRGAAGRRRAAGRACRSGVAGQLESTDADDAAGPRTAALRTAVRSQALGDADGAAPLWVVTRGAVTTDRLETGSPTPRRRASGASAGSPRWSTRGRWGGLVDLPDGPPTTRGRARLAGCLRPPAARTRSRSAASGVFVRRLVRAPAATGRTAGWSPRGTVLVTGGTGALGAHVARWLAARAAPSTSCCSSRRGPDAPGAAELRAELDRARAPRDGRRLRRRRPGRAGPVLAGSPPTHPLDRASCTPPASWTTASLDGLTADRLDAGAAPPRSTRPAHLHELTRDLDLSRVRPVLLGRRHVGSAGQGNYAAANAFLDALAEHRRAAGLPATSLAWGPWAGGGMAADGAAGRPRCGAARMPPMDPASRIDRPRSSAARRTATPPLVVADVDWDPFAAGVRRRPPQPAARRRPRGAGCPPTATTPGPPTAGAAGLAGRAPRRAARGGPRARPLARPGARPGRRRPRLRRARTRSTPTGAFQDLGFDSLTAVELRNRLAAATGLRLPATLVFDHPTADRARRATCAPSSSAPPRHAAAPPPRPRRRPPTTSRSRSSAWAAASPAASHSPEDLWQLVADGARRDRRLPRPTAAGTSTTLYDPDPDRAGTTYTREGGFLHDAGRVRRRLLRHLARARRWRWTRSSGCCWRPPGRRSSAPASTRTSLRGSRTGVFVGAMRPGLRRPAARRRPRTSRATSSPATRRSVVSGRVAYTFGLEGPAVTVDTACSSSLVALHLAAQALRAASARWRWPAASP